MASGFTNSVSFCLMILLLVSLQLLSLPLSSMGGRPLTSKGPKSHNVYMGTEETEFMVGNGTAPSHPGQGHPQPPGITSTHTPRWSKFSGPGCGEGHCKLGTEETEFMVRNGTAPSHPGQGHPQPPGIPSTHTPRWSKFSGPGCPGEGHCKLGTEETEFMVRNGTAPSPPGQGHPQPSGIPSTHTPRWSKFSGPGSPGEGHWKFRSGGRN